MSVPTFFEEYIMTDTNLDVFEPETGGTDLFFKPQHEQPAPAAQLYEDNQALFSRTPMHLSRLEAELSRVKREFAHASTLMSQPSGVTVDASTASLIPPQAPTFPGAPVVESLSPTASNSSPRSSKRQRPQDSPTAATTCRRFTAEEKKERRRLQNRLAQRRSRARKRARLDGSVYDESTEEFEEEVLLREMDERRRAESAMGMPAGTDREDGHTSPTKARRTAAVSSPTIGLLPMTMPVQAPSSNMPAAVASAFAASDAASSSSLQPALMDAGKRAFYASSPASSSTGSTSAAFVPHLITPPQPPASELGAKPLESPAVALAPASFTVSSPSVLAASAAPTPAEYRQQAQTQLQLQLNEQGRLQRQADIDRFAIGRSGISKTPVLDETGESIEMLRNMIASPEMQIFRSRFALFFVDLTKVAFFDDLAGKLTMTRMDENELFLLAAASAACSRWLGSPVEAAQFRALAGRLALPSHDSNTALALLFLAYVHLDSGEKVQAVQHAAKADVLSSSPEMTASCNFVAMICSTSQESRSEAARRLAKATAVPEAVTVACIFDASNPGAYANEAKAIRGIVGSLASQRVLGAL